MRYGQGKPKIIRLVTRKDAQGRPKIAADRKADIRMERVTAKGTRPCCYHHCSKGGFIQRDTEYAKVYANEGVPKRIKGRLIYSPRDYHFGCVPPPARPLVRFLETPKA